MLLFFDESGDFNPSAKQTDVWVQTGVAITEDAYKLLNSFLSHGFRSRELKGSKLTIKNRIKVAKFLNVLDGIAFSVTVSASSYFPEDVVKINRETQAKIFGENKTWYIQHGGKVDGILKSYDRSVKLMIFQSRLSDPEYIQHLFLLKSIPRTLQASMVSFLDLRYMKYFSDFHFKFDAKLANKLSTMEKYIEFFLLPLLGVAPRLASKKLKSPFKLILIDEWSKGGHTFVKEFQTPDGYIDLNKLFRNGLVFQNSEKDRGLQIADFVANTVKKAIENPSDRKMSIAYGLIAPKFLAEKGGQVLQVLSLPEYSPLDKSQFARFAKVSNFKKHIRALTQATDRA